MSKLQYFILGIVLGVGLVVLVTIIEGNEQNLCNKCQFEIGVDDEPPRDLVDHIFLCECGKHYVVKVRTYSDLAFPLTNATEVKLIHDHNLVEVK